MNCTNNTPYLVDALSFRGLNIRVKGQQVVWPDKHRRCRFLVGFQNCVYMANKLGNKVGLSVHLGRSLVKIFDFWRNKVDVTIWVTR